MFYNVFKTGTLSWTTSCWTARDTSRSQTLGCARRECSERRQRRHSAGRRTTLHPRYESASTAKREYSQIVKRPEYKLLGYIMVIIVP